MVPPPLDSMGLFFSQLSTFWLYILINATIEVPIYLFITRFSKTKTEYSTFQLITLFTIMNFATYSIFLTYVEMSSEYLWFFKFFEIVLLGEIFVVVTEAIIYKIMMKAEWYKAFGFSILANLVSAPIWYVIGPSATFLYWIFS
ncbi:hypothetical protein JW962_01985 [Candidatus Dojkabacteria bacterium]|nr:hypothetical protein [Candidatus Dojkabacteria bacterium]